MADQKGLFQGLADLSFREYVTVSKVKFLYILAMVLGAIVALFVVFKGLQESPAQGVLAIILAAVGLFLWVLYIRVVLESLMAVFRISDNIERITGGANR